MKPIRAFFVLLFLSVCSFSIASWYYTVYAEYLFYLAKHTQFTNSVDNSRFKIGVYGSPQMFESTRHMSLTKRLNERLIYVEDCPSFPSSPNYHILFVGKAKASELTKAVSFCKKHNILLVSDAEGAYSKGSDVEFLEDQAGNIKFRINSVACQDRGIKVSMILQNMAVK